MHSINLVSNTIVSSKFPYANNSIRCVHVSCKTGEHGKLTKTRNQTPGYQRVWGSRLTTRAITDQRESQNEQVVTVEENNQLLDSTSPKGTTTWKATIIINKMKGNIFDKFKEIFFSPFGTGMTIELISEDVDPSTNAGKVFKASLQSGSSPSERPDSVEYSVDLKVPSDFGSPGAILITNLLVKEFRLVEIVLQGSKGGPIRFPANSWIHSHKDNPESRIIFKDQACLPSQTSPGIKDLRAQDLSSLRGDGKGERKPHERIYDYDVYNDLGFPDKSDDLARPTLGGKEKPYPRRCRTGRPSTKKDPLLESAVESNLPSYVPRDEYFEEVKDNSLFATGVKGVLQSIGPTIAAALSQSDLPLESYSDIDELYHREDDKAFTSFLSNVLKFSLPPVVKGDRLFWLRDSEFARQAIAGINPINIELLKEFPIISKLDPAVYGPQESAITKEFIEQELNGMSFEEAIEKKRLFILDYHDILLPYTERINSLPDNVTYASRTIFFHTLDGILMPVLIELSLPPKSPHSRNKHIFSPGKDATNDWLWRLAKAHVSSNDATIHQFISHWVRIHAVTEPYIIAAHRQLSSMHPIFKLLHPHMRDTLKINSTARQSLINAEGQFEVTYVPNKFGLDMTSEYYKNTWRFGSEDLPADLLRRGMAVEDASDPSGVRLVIEDYPYAADGLLIWSAIKEMVESYVNYYYNDQTSVADDLELQAWWNEIKNKGHEEKREEPWWPKLTTNQDLSYILTSIIWMISGHHAVINFSQYSLGSYVPQRPTLMRKLIPEEDDPQYETFLLFPERSFFNSLPSKLQAAKGLALLQNVSTHSPDQLYLNELPKAHSFLNGDPQVIQVFKKFSSKLEDIENIISTRNKDRRLKHRCGAGIAPYEELLPSAGPGLNSKGIPISICM